MKPLGTELSGSFIVPAVFWFYEKYKVAFQGIYWKNNPSRARLILSGRVPEAEKYMNQLM